MDSLVLPEFQLSFLGYVIPFSFFLLYGSISFCLFIYLFIFVCIYILYAFFFSLPYLVLVLCGCVLRRLSISPFQVQMSRVGVGNVLCWLVSSFLTPLAMDSSFEGKTPFSLYFLFLIVILFLFLCRNHFWVLIIVDWFLDWSFESYNVWVRLLLIEVLRENPWSVSNVHGIQVAEHCAVCDF